MKILSFLRFMISLRIVIVNSSTSPFNESFELIFFVSFPSFTLFEFSSVIVKMRI